MRKFSLQHYALFFRMDLRRVAFGSEGMHAITAKIRGISLGLLRNGCQAWKGLSMSPTSAFVHQGRFLQRFFDSLIQ
jgi:hypothetical protein